MKAKVFFTSFKAGNTSMVDKAERVIRAAGFDSAISEGDNCAIKIHFGEEGNLAYIRPQYARRVAEMVKKRGAKPFFTDANTLYKGARANGIDHIECAIKNGFDFSVVGAPIVIADGITGKDFVKVPVEGKHFKSVNIGSAAMHADSMVVMTHFKGHEMAGIGGAIKNLGMGLGSRSGKQQMHSDVLPTVAADVCVACGKCAKWCPAEAITIADVEGKRQAVIDSKKCIGCGECVATCPVEAISPNWESSSAVMQEKMAEYAAGALHGKKGKVIYVSFVSDVSPNCDCWGYNDMPIVANVGILASTDPVALDMECARRVNTLAGLPGSACEGMKPGEDKFRKLYHDVDWAAQIRHAEKLGLGSTDYEVVEM